MKTFHLLVAGALAAGGPMIHVDGKTVPPRMFWGRSGSRRYKIGPDWTPFPDEIKKGFGFSILLHEDDGQGPDGVMTLPAATVQF